MKIKIFLFAFFLMPFLTFSQQLEKEYLNSKKEIKQKVVKHVDLSQVIVNQTTPKQMIKPLTESERISFGVPEDFPRCQNSGNKRKDEDDYYKAQQIWIKNNPDRFGKIKANSL